MEQKTHEEWLGREIPSILALAERRELGGKPTGGFRRRCRSNRTLLGCRAWPFAAASLRAVPGLANCEGGVWVTLDGEKSPLRGWHSAQNSRVRRARKAVLFVRLCIILIEIPSALQPMR